MKVSQVWSEVRFIHKRYFDTMSCRMQGESLKAAQLAKATKWKAPVLFSTKVQIYLFFPASQSATLQFYRGHVSSWITTRHRNNSTTSYIFQIWFHLVFNNCIQALSQRS